ncbi:MAG: amino acid adenylation domain-containing protein [Actinomycetota bacterium]
MTDTTVAAEKLQERLAQLSPEKRALLEKKLLAQGRSPDSETARIPRRADPQAAAELSHSQELMWLLDRLSPGGNAYNAPSANRIHGPVDAELLHRALQLQLDRHDVLRTRYPEIDGRPTQVVETGVELKLEIVDLSGQPLERAEAEANRLCSATSERPFDLEREIPIRNVLYKLAPDDYILLSVIHHIAVDGWSKGVLWNELSILYDAVSKGVADPLPELPLQYADFAVWHRRNVSDGKFAGQLDYWKDRLAGAPAILELPSDHPRPDVRSGAGGHTGRLLPVSSLQGLHEVARAEGATLFMAVLAAFGALLGRYSGQDDVVIGTPIAGRSRVELEKLVGYFMNTLALRVDLSGDPTFRQLVRRARECTLGAFANQEVPFEEVVTAVNPPRDLSRTPLFQVMLVLQNQKKSVFRPLGMDAEPISFGRDWSKFDLTVGMGERANGLNTTWEYSSDLFERSTIERMIHNLDTFVAAVVASPDAPMSTFALLDAEESHQVVEDFNPAQQAIREPSTVWGRFVEQVERTPAALAVEDSHQQLTYAQLRAAAQIVAAHLGAAGVGRGDVVGVCVDHSVELVVADLGVLAAGAACLPLDPGYPAARIAAVVDEAQPPVVLTSGPWAAAVPATAARTLLVEGLLAAPLEAATARPGIQPDDAAYVIFTSGSTGRPKGVVLSHRGLVNHADASRELYGLRADDRVLQFASVAFDISVEEIYPTLLSGGAMVARPAELPLGGPELVDWLTAARISVLDLPTAFWHEWVGDLSLRGLALPAPLRHVTVGGEKASAATYDVWAGLAGDRVSWINTYGPTEGSVIATAWTPPAGFRSRPGRDLPIGTPVRNTRIYLLDPAGHPVPVGVRGELWIGGAGVATGYLGRPDLTAERFSADPFSTEPGARMYRTGDLARHRPDGNVEFSGRADQQVKLRGFRIEPGEIEAALVQQSEVTEALVLVRASAGSEALIAYVACPADAGDDALSSSLRARLIDVLPAYLVPSAVVVLPALPRTPNGKVNRDELPDPVLAAREIVAPRDEVETQIATLWCELLGISEVSVNESFFDLGGNSLLAVRMFALLERRHSHKLPLAAIVATPTIEGLAAQLRPAGASGVREGFLALQPLQPKGNRRPLFLVHDVWGQVIGYRNIVAEMGTDQPVYGFEPVGADGSYPMHSTIEAMASHYVAEMIQLQPEGPYMIGGSCFGGDVAYEMAHQLRALGREADLVILLDAVPFGHGKSQARRNRRRRRADWLRIGGMPRDERKAFVKFRLVETRNQIYNKIWYLGARRHLRSGALLQGRLHNVRYLQNFAAKHYVAPKYDGAVTLVLPKMEDRRPDDRRHEWTKLAAMVNLVEIEGDGISHRAFLNGDHVPALARAIRAAVDETIAQQL